MNTEVTIAGVKFKNPVMTASGTFGSGAEYSEFVDVLNASYETEKGEASTADYTTNDMELSFSWWSDEGVAGRINIPVEDYKSISGILTRTDSETDAAKFIVSVGKEVLFTTSLDAKNNNVAFNVEIPEGADMVSVRWTRANKDVTPVIRVSNFVMCKKYLAPEGGTSTEEGTQEGETQVEGETQEGGTSVEGETQEGGTSVEGETQEGGTSVEGETQEGGTSAEGETQTGDTPVGNDTQEGENQGEAQSQASAAPTV